MELNATSLAHYVKVHIASILHQLQKLKTATGLWFWRTTPHPHESRSNTYYLNRRNRHGIWLGGILYFINENGRHLHVPGNGGTRKSRSYHMIQLKIEPTLKARTRVGV
jgi:hypothetical protein